MDTKKEKTIIVHKIKDHKKRMDLDFNAISIKIASPEKIRSWSHGEVTKPETINYRTQRSERGGLFDERIFGPEKDYECYCGKYRRIRYKNVICEKCGVEVTRSIVRRERMGHIELATPIAHIWYLRGIPSRIARILNVSMSDLEKVVYFAGYIITKINEDEKKSLLLELEKEYKSKTKSIKEKKDKDNIKDQLSSVKKDIESLKVGKILDEANFHHLSLKFGTAFEAGIGAEAIYNMFCEINLGELEMEITTNMEKASSIEKDKLQKRLNIIKSMKIASVRPEWMFLTVLPIIPPALRPMVALEGGRHATSDVNDLYRRVINRNNRLKKLKALNAPDVILRNEKRILQEAVDALIDNSIRRGTEGTMSQGQRRPLKSLSDMLKGKQGRFRQNLLGKRVDYSGRSVIVVGPDLKINQCGLPKHMALELFRPFVISKLLESEIAFNIRGANRLIDDGISEVWAILEKVIEDKYVLLNRAPTLHRLGIQAFKPVLIEGNAIQIHPLVCSAFNADFDGDQMAVHVPLSEKAQEEAKKLMSAEKNILKPGNGDVIANPKLDMVLGCYWMTKVVDGDIGEGEYFSSPNSAITAYEFGKLGFRAKVNVMGTNHLKYKEFEGKTFKTTVGRILFNSILPKDFLYINQEMTMKELSTLVEDLILKYGLDGIPEILDKIKNFGFKYSTVSGVTWGIDDLPEIKEKEEIIKEATKEVKKIDENYEKGLLSDDEKYRMSIETWQRARTAIEKLIPSSLSVNGSVHDLLASKARGSIGNLSQMIGMKGLIVNTASETINFPIIPSYREGLSPIEYFVTTHGARKGGADTALNTAKAGYLTRKMVDVGQDVIIHDEDCGDKDGRLYTKETISGFDIGIASNIDGKILAKDIKDSKGKILYKKGHLISKRDADLIEDNGITEASAYSSLTCKSIIGVCKKCYGLDLGKNRMVKIGEAVGIVAAQAIGEPGTQLTMRTFHKGGIASAGGDITMGLPRVEEIFERREPKNQATICTINGIVTDINSDKNEKKITVLQEAGGTKIKKKEEVVYKIIPVRSILVKVGDEVVKGDILTDGSVSIKELFKYGGKIKTENYILTEISKVYELQGASIARKHIEVIIRKMFSRKKIKKSGDTKFVSGQIQENYQVVVENNKIKEKGKEEASVETILLGISEVAHTSSSFLSAASFQHTTKVLIDSSINGRVDLLKGLKENVILGRLIPAGTGINDSFMEENIEEEIEKNKEENLDK